MTCSAKIVLPSNGFDHVATFVRPQTFTHAASKSCMYMDLESR